MRRDLALALVLAVAGAFVALGRGDMSWLPLAVSAVALVAAVAVSRRLPLLAPVIVVAAATLDRPALYDAVLLPAVSVLGYLAGRRVVRARTGAVTLAGLSAAAVLSAEVRAADPWAWFDPALTVVLALAFPALLGFYRSRDERRAAADRTRERRAVVREARLRERTRIARDMHDSLGHELSLLAVRAGALELAPDLSERHRRAVGELRAAAGAATGRLHEIIDLLRDDAGPPPDDDPTVLVDRARDAGLRVDVHGDLGAAPTPLPGVLREALTNAAKHAPGAPVTVRLADDGGDAVLTVANPVPAGASPGSGGRRGLAAAAETLRAAGGSLGTDDAGDRFTLTARVPRDATTAAPGEQPVPGRRRWRIAVVLAPTGITAGLVALIGVAVLTWYAVAAARATLDPADFAALRVGSSTAAVRPVLPARQAPDRGPDRTAPRGADCRYYRSAATPFAAYDVYRVCFAGGRLVAKDVL